MTREVSQSPLVFFPLVFPANDFTRSPPAECRALLSQRLEQAPLYLQLYECNQINDTTVDKFNIGIHPSCPVIAYYIK